MQACLGPPMQVAGTSWNRSNSKRIGCTGCINLNVILYHVHGHWISCLRLEFTNFCLKTNFKCEYDRNIPSLFLIILWMSKFVCSPKLCLKKGCWPLKEAMGASFFNLLSFLASETLVVGLAKKS